MRRRQSQAEAVAAWAELRRRIREPAIRAARTRDEQRRWAQQRTYNTQMNALRWSRRYR